MNVKRPREYTPEELPDMSTSTDKMDALLRKSIREIAGGHRPTPDDMVRLLCELVMLNDASRAESLNLTRSYLALARMAGISSAPDRPKFEFLAKGAVMAETEDHDVVAVCIGRNRWVVSLFRPDSDEGVDAGRVFTRDEVRQFVADLFEKERPK